MSDRNTPAWTPPRTPGWLPSSAPFLSVTPPTEQRGDSPTAYPGNQSMNMPSYASIGAVYGQDTQGYASTPYYPHRAPPNTTVGDMTSAAEDASPNRPFPMVWLDGYRYYDVGNGRLVQTSAFHAAAQRFPLNNDAEFLISKCHVMHKEWPYAERFVHPPE